VLAESVSPPTTVTVSDLELLPSEILTSVVPAPAAAIVNCSEFASTLVGGRILTTPPVVLEAVNAPVKFNSLALSVKDVGAPERLIV
jgi:hypothetical protein